MTLEDYKKTNFQKKVLIFGLGLQGGGVSSVKFFSTITDKIKITDLKTKSALESSLKKVAGIKFEERFGGHSLEDIEWADIVVFNQDIFNKDADSAYIKKAQELGKIIETEAGLFLELCKCPIVGITGTRGKTTTTVACAKLLTDNNYKIYLGGNIPDSENLANVEKTKECDFAVLELSNFQLHGINFKKISPHIAILTSISPDHLISYKKIEDYIEDKVVITKYQNNTDYLIINKNISFLDKFIENNQTQITYFDQKLLPQNWQLKIPGLHNRQNLAAVYILGKILNIDELSIKKTLESFEGVEYRLQKIKDYKGITFINDTTASTPTAAAIALNSFPQNKIIWIAGGNSKNLPLDDLVTLASQKVKKFVFLKGNATDNLIENLRNQTFDFKVKTLGVFDNFELAVKTSIEAAQEGDVILLSPGFTSFSMFNNEFERGKLFNDYVNKYTSV